MNNSLIIWALLDSRVGNRNQILGILDQLKINYKIIEIRYNFFANLPNFILQLLSSNIHIKPIKEFIRAPYPDIIISCGRRSAIVSLELKRILSYKPFCVHLMYPKFTFFKKKFDLIFTPEHDKIKQSKFIRKFLGSPSKIKLVDYKSNKYKKPIIFIIIGGDNGYYKLYKEEVEKIIYQVLKKMNKKGTLLITTSRRSSDQVIKKINEISKKNDIIKEVFHPNVSNNNNPYLKFLSFANEIVVTGDSISMVSDACETKKPVRIYFNKRFCSKKHINFCHTIIEKGYAFPFETLGNKVKILNSLETSKKVAKYIIHSFKNG